MLLQKWVLLLGVGLFGNILLGQSLFNKRYQKFVVTSDTLTIDSLSIVPNTLKMYDNNNQLIDSSFYYLDPLKSIIILKKKFPSDSIIVSYQSYPINFYKVYFNKDFGKVKNADNNSPFVYQYNVNKKEDIIFFDDLQKNGSLSRGVAFGNNQNAVVNSTLNLQLSGKLTEKINILAAITDENVPIQPDGTTQQLQDFDKVFVQIYTNNHQLTAGDFLINKPNSYFLVFNKKGQGGHWSSKYKSKPFLGAKDSTQFLSQASAAAARGRFARNVIQGIEGNQGPYALKGANNESFIIVLSGTEKVFIDGMLLTRGQQNDYVIDYNTAQLTFTSKQLITKDRRIVVEFEYADRNYQRSFYHLNQEAKNDKMNIRFNLYSEQDNPNRPFLQNLTDEQKLVLALAGDDPQKAIAPNVIQLDNFDSNLILYEKRDSIVNGKTYQIYVYSTNPNLAKYQVKFAYVGQGKGNYKYANTLANGKVFTWIAPDINQVPQGDYEPITQLIAPNQKRVTTLATDYKVSATTTLFTEIATSKNDLNRLSDIDKNDDHAYAFKFTLQNKTKIGKADHSPWEHLMAITYEQVDRNFTPFERFRSVEFDRDWNTRNLKLYGNEYLPSLQFAISKQKFGNITYDIKSFIKGNTYNGLQNLLNVDWQQNKWFVKSMMSLTHNKTANLKSVFVRDRTSLKRQLKYFNIGFNTDNERNITRDNSTDTLVKTAYMFNDFNCFVESSDSSKLKWRVYYRPRLDFLAQNNTLKKASTGQNFGSEIQIAQNAKQQFKMTTNYRILTINNPILLGQQPEKTLTNRLEHTLNLFKNVVNSNLFYEIGSGLEIKKEFVFIEVPAGQGVYTWIDYNADAIKQINEFEITPFKDQARYIKFYQPTAEYIKTYSNQFNYVLNLKAPNDWQNEKGIKSLLHKFNNQTALRTDQKISNKEFFKVLNTFFKNVPNDTTLIINNSALRNTLYFNRINPIWGFDLNYQNNKNKILLINGYDERSASSKGIRFRWSFTRKLTANFNLGNGEKRNYSEYAASRNYKIKFSEIDPQLTYQPMNNIRITINYKVTSKQNAQEFGNEKSKTKNLGVDTKYNILRKGNLQGRFNFIAIKYNSTANSAVGFEMLEGLKSGNNYTWQITYQRNISNNLQINFNYDGRKAQASKAIHTGNVQVRAFF